MKITATQRTVTINGIQVIKDIDEFDLEAERASKAIHSMRKMAVTKKNSPRRPMQCMPMNERTINRYAR